MVAKKKAKSAPVEEDIEEFEDEFEDMDEAEEAEAAPKKKSSKAPEVEFGVKDLCDHISEIQGKEYKTREMRNLLRAMARRGELDREIVAGNRARYNWPGGLDNPEVKRILKAVAAGEIEASKKEALDKLKADSEAKRKKKAAKKAAKAAKEQEEEIVEIDDDELDFEDED